MKKGLFMLTIIALAVCAGCGEQAGKKEERKNPLLETWNTPYGAPPFNEVQLSDYMPAFQQAFKEHNEELKAIEAVQDPNFDNVILAFDRAGGLLDKVSNVFFCIKSADTNDEIQRIAKDLLPMLTEHSNGITFNEKLFAQIKAVYDKRHSLNLAPDELRVTEKIYSDFTRYGANLSPEKKEELKQVNIDLANLCMYFDDNLLAETKTFQMFVDNEADLAGLSEDLKAAAALSAKEAGHEGQWLFTADKSSWIPFLQSAENRSLREKLYRGWFMRGNNNNENDNKKLITDIVNLRLKKANLLGYKNFAEYRIDVNMAKTPENAMNFLNEVWEVALPAAVKERDAIQAMIKKEGGSFKMESWDWWYYAEKIRKEKYDLDEEELKPYLSLQNSIDGIFYVANKLYGITFNKRADIPVYHPDVEVYEAKEADGTSIGLLYMDYFPRPGKSGGAWCTGFRDGGYDNQGNRVHPLVSVVCNFTPPVGNKPALLNWDENTTLFHEFGHALHGLFSDGRFKRTAGDMPRDMVELPSQILERWAAEPEVLKVYAKHYQTGEIIPDALIAKMQNSSTFNEGFSTTEIMAATILDMNWHITETPNNTDVNVFEKNAMDKIHLISEILPRYRSTYFSHIFTGEGYAAGYYVYCWAEVLDADAFDAFKQAGIFNQELAAKFRKHVLTECGEGEGLDQYRKFRGQDPSYEPYYKSKGLK